ncbi:Hsp70 family protein [Stenotrophomonas sp. CFBP 13725]|uniref:Hsp70 family protein n=1 Tax=Stenotrophomonas sp. CFBP 13725 TaxID=2775297 RepID=UPI00177D9AE6|nr:Hsp70 family protein [Stenotrophomonas sp. CFBP 13725]MBD8636921.1 Hsp70 family protein [Stenotrophomonas sp. CFBP 13725]
MRLGIDFGTSNSAAAIVRDGRVEPIRFGDADQFRTTVYFPGIMQDPGEFTLEPGQEHELQELIDTAAREARAAGHPRPLEALRREALRTLRRQWMERRMAEPRSSSQLLQNAVYGDEALEAYFEENEGNLVQSPKSMLGYNLHPRARQTITGIATHILEHIRLTASAQLGVPVREALLGRPVQFRSSIGDAGNDQALDILREAAVAAGFDQVDFLEEPAAAAMHYHATSSDAHDAVIVDIGGGTTDIAHARVGGGEAPRIHRAWGIARGGTDIDLALSLAAYMPLFGRGITRVPTHHYVEAATVQDMTRQRDFRQHTYDHVENPYGSRLQALQDTGNTARLYREVERAKISLSSTPAHASPLPFIEKGLQADTSADGLGQAAHAYLGQLQELLAQVRQDIGHEPDAVFLTGGMSRAGYLRQVAAAAFPDARQVHGDASFGVVQGLALAAAGTP